MWPVRDRAATVHAASTTPTYDYPQRVAAGDTLIAFVGADGNADPAVPTGWNDLGLAQVGGNANGRAMWRKATGAEAGGTFGVSLSSNVLSGAIVWAVRGLDPDMDPPEAASTTNASHTTTASVAPSLSPSGGARPYLWLTAGSMDSPNSPNTLLVDWPASSFTQFWQGATNPTAAGNTIHGAERLLSASTLNPGEVGTHGGPGAETSVFWVCFTIAVPVGSPPATNFPVVESAATSFDPADVSINHLVTLPSGIATGDLLLAETSIVDENESITFTPPVGWTAETLLRNGGDTTSNRNAFQLWWKVADGTESSPVQFVTNEARRTATVMRRISGHTAFEWASNIDGPDNLPDPPSLTPTFGEADTLWIAGVGVPSGMVLRRPALNFGGNKQEVFAAEAPSATVMSGVGSYTVPQVNPLTMRIGSPSFRWIAYTIGIQGQAAPPAPPDTPIGVTATAISSTQIRVDWTDVAFETGYRIERSDDGITGWAPVGSTAANVVTFVDGGLLPETEYCYRVIAFNNDGESDPSDVVCATTFPEATSIPNPDPGSAWLRHPTNPVLDMAVCVTEMYERFRPFSAVQPIGGGLPTVVTGAPSGRNYTLVISLRTIAEQRSLEDVLTSPLVYYQPPCDRDLWMAPETESIVVTKVGRIRQTTVNFIETGPFPQPSPESLFEQPFPPPEEEEEEEEP